MGPNYGLTCTVVVVVVAVVVVAGVVVSLVVVVGVVVVVAVVVGVVSGNNEELSELAGSIMYSYSFHVRLA